MQAHAPEAFDVTHESEETKKLYGLDDKVTETFGKQCLMARRLAERGRADGAGLSYDDG